MRQTRNDAVKTRSEKAWINRASNSISSKGSARCAHLCLVCVCTVSVLHAANAVVQPEHMFMCIHLYVCTYISWRAFANCCWKTYSFSKEENTLYAETHSVPVVCERFVGRENILCETTDSLCGIELSVCAVCTQYAENAVYMTYMRVFAQRVFMCCAHKHTHTNIQRRTHTRTHTLTHRDQPCIFVKGERSAVYIFFLVFVNR